MKQGIVKFSKEFKTPIGTAEWVGLELPYDIASECPKEVLTTAKTIVEQWFKESNAGHPNLLNSNEYAPGPTPIIQKQTEDREIGLTPELLMSCTDIVALQTFYPLVFKLKKSDDDLKNAYNKRKAELVALETRELLENTERLRKATSKK